jgi:DNA adenine methylase
MPKTEGPIKFHGGKKYLADWIIAHFPPRAKLPNNPKPGDPGYLHFVEPYAGGLQVLLANNPEGISELVSDINPQLTTFWRVLQSPTRFEEFHRLCVMTPFSEGEFNEAVAHYKDLSDDPVKVAHRFFVRCRQSLTGRMKDFASISRKRTRRGMNEQVAAWLNAIEGLPLVHERLKRVVVRNAQDAIGVIKDEDGPRTLFYLDPPYLKSTRASPEVYEHEMTAQQHIELLATLSNIKGRFLLSGYRSDLYDEWATSCGWNRHECSIANHASGADTKKVMTECLYTNY